MSAAAVPTEVAASRAAAQLYERHRPWLRALCRRYLRSDDEADDAVQATFVRALVALNRGSAPRDENAWLATIARNVCLTRLGAARRREVSCAPDELPATAAADVRPVEFRDALAELGDTQRRAILLREWRGLSYREIANELRISEAASQALVFRARRALARTLRDRLPKGIDLGGLAAAAKSALAGGSAVKLAAAGLAVTGVTALAADAGPRSAPPARGTADAAALSRVDGPGRPNDAATRHPERAAAATETGRPRAPRRALPPAVRKPRSRGTVPGAPLPVEPTAGADEAASPGSAGPPGRERTPEPAGPAPQPETEPKAGAAAQPPAESPVASAPAPPVPAVELPAAPPPPLPALPELPSVPIPTAPPVEPPTVTVPVDLP